MDLGSLYCLHSAAIFTARCISAAYAVMPCPSVRPSVRLAVGFVYCVKMSNELILMFFFTVG